MVKKRIECDVCHIIYLTDTDEHDVGDPNFCCEHCAWKFSHKEGEPQPPHTCKEAGENVIYH